MHCVGVPVHDTWGDIQGKDLPTSFVHSERTTTSSEQRLPQASHPHHTAQLVNIYEIGVLTGRRMSKE